MLKKILLTVIMACMISGVLSGCSGQKAEVKKPDILQVRNICNLATLESYYHNVAKAEKVPEKGITHIGEETRKFWIEYTGITRLGIDMSKVKMEIDGSDIEITLPEAEVLDISIDKKTLNEDSYITSQNSWNKNKITAEDQTEAIKKAQEEMRKTAEDNSSLLLIAQNRAKVLIENYINQLGEITGVQYHITWEYLDKDA